MLMCVYRHYSKGSERHAESKRKRKKEGERVVRVWRETVEKRNREGERVPVLSVTDDSRGYAARGVTYPPPPP